VAISLLITALASGAFLGAVLPWIALWRKRYLRSRVSLLGDSKGVRLRLCAANTWALEELCRAITTIVSAHPGLRRVCFDLTHIRRLGPSSVASLRYALRELRKAGVEVDIQGTGGRTARVVTRGSRAATDVVAPDEHSVERRTLH
jgi:hypothetical protein